LAQAAAPRVVTVGSLPGSYQPASAMALSLDGNRLAVGRGNRILIYDVAGTNLTLLQEQTAHREVVRALAWNTNNTRLASGSFREITVWEATNMQSVWSGATNLVGRVTGLEFAGDRLLAADS